MILIARHILDVAGQNPNLKRMEGVFTTKNHEICAKV